MLTKHEREMNIQRFSQNPLITPQDIQPSFPDWEVLGVFNAGVVQLNDETILLLRIAERPKGKEGKVNVPIVGQSGEMSTLELDLGNKMYDYDDPRVIRNKRGRVRYLTSLSHFRVARSKDGIHFEVDNSAIWPEGPLECWGIEDPRITPIGDEFYITYSAVSDKGVSVGLMTTRDFRTFRRDGIMLPPTNKDVVIFPERIQGRYYMMHRPVPEEIGMPEMWLAESEDLKHWGQHRFLFGVRDGKWDESRIGAGCVPIRTDDGWLILYHGADRESRYCMGAALLDLEQPWKVIARMDEPLLVPEAEYEKNGFFQDVIFSCGAVMVDGNIWMYYGACDDTIACASIPLEPLLARLTKEVK